MKHTTNILEELLESEYKGLIYIDEQNRIGSYSKRAKEITGIISEDGRCHRCRWCLQEQKNQAAV